MGYDIHIPVDWLVVGQWIAVIEPAHRTGDQVDTPYMNAVKGFSKDGVFYQHCGTTPVYFAPFTEIGRTLFATKKDAEDYILQTRGDVNRVVGATLGELKEYESEE